MSSLNKVMLIGRLGKDPEVRTIPSGECVASFSVATSETWKDKSGQKQEKTEWHNISVFGRLAEIVRDYVKKGSLIYVEGSLTTRKWTDKNNVDRYVTEIKMSEMKMLGSKSDSTNHSTPAPQSNYQTSKNQSESAPVVDYDNDVPF